MAVSRKWTRGTDKLMELMEFIGIQALAVFELTLSQALSSQSIRDAHLSAGPNVRLW